MSILLALLLASFTSVMSDVRLDLKLALFNNFDKVGHFLSVFSLTVAGLFAFPRVRARKIFATTIGIGALIELTQLFGPRSADYADFAMSLAGTAVVALIYYGTFLRNGK